MPLSALSPYAAPFVPGSVHPTQEGPIRDTANSEPMSLTGYEDAQDPNLWMWGDCGPQIMPTLSPSSSFFVPGLASAPMAPFLHNFAAYPPRLFYGLAPAHPPMPLCPDLVPGGRRRRRKARRAAAKTGKSEPEGRKESEAKGEESCARVKLLRETASQTEFPQRISETMLHALSSSSLLMDRCEVALLTPTHRTVSVTTSSDLLLALSPPSPPPPPPPAPRINYAAVVKAAAPVRTVPVPTPTPAAAPTGPKLPSSQPPMRPNPSGTAKKRGKKKIKAPLIDLEAVMKERETERASALLAAAGGGGGVREERLEARGGRRQEEEAAGEFPGLLSNDAKRTAAEKLAAAWRTSRNTAGVTLSDFVTRKEEVAAAKEETEEEVAPHKSSDAVLPLKSPQKSLSSKPSRVKFRPLFSIGGGSTQAELYRAKEAEKKEVELDLVLRAPLLKPKRAAELPKGKKVANPLDSTGVTKRGKERENPRPKRPSLMKKIILKEREEKKRLRAGEQRVEESGHQSCPETAASGAEYSEEEEAGAQSAPEDSGRGDEEEEAEAVEAEAVQSAEADGAMGAAADQSAEAVPDSWEEEEEEAEAENAENRQTLCSLHSRRFREYCNQMIGKEINECVVALLSDLVRFQDRLHARDPVKARQRRRLVCGLKEVTKHLKLRRLKLVIMSPDVERIESKGGLDDAVRSLLALAEQLSVPYVFSLPRRLLGKALLKPVPVAVVGIFNYEGAEVHVRRLSGLVEEGRTQYRLVTRISTAAAPEGPCMWLAGHNRNTSEPLSDLSFP